MRHKTALFAFRFSLTSVTLLALTACSAFQPTTQSVTVSTTTPSASIEANGVPVGTAPVTFIAKRNKRLNLVATKPGYHPSMMEISLKPSHTFILDAIGGSLFLFPWIGLLTPGAFELSTTQVDMALHKKK